MNLTIMCDIDGILDQLKQLQYVDLTRPSPAFRVRGSGFVRLGKKKQSMDNLYSVHRMFCSLLVSSNGVASISTSIPFHVTILRANLPTFSSNLKSCGGIGSIQGVRILSAVSLMIDTIAEKCHCWRYDKIFSIGAQLSFLHWCRSMQYVQRKRGYWTTVYLA